MGGAGFIGSAIVPALQAQGHEVCVLDNLSFGSRKFICLDDDHFFKEDVLDVRRMEEIIGGFSPDIIIHLAAIHYIPYCNQHPFESTRINIFGTRNILQAARKAKPEKILFASTAAVYPVCDHALNEECPPDPIDIYGLSKLAGEHLCREFFLETSIPTIVCRFFNAFGPNETNPHLIPEIQRQVLAGQRKILLGNLEPRRDFIHTSDMARGVSLLLEKVTGGIHVFNLGSGVEYSIPEIVKMFSNAIGENIKIEIDPERVRKSERMHLLANVSKLKGFGWEPRVGIQDGINDLVRI